MHTHSHTPTHTHTHTQKTYYLNLAALKQREDQCSFSDAAGGLVEGTEATTEKSHMHRLLKVIVHQRLAILHLTQLTYMIQLS